jgi:hypothetical protein
MGLTCGANLIKWANYRINELRLVLDPENALGGYLENVASAMVENQSC